MAHKLHRPRQRSWTTGHTTLLSDSLFRRNSLCWRYKWKLRRDEHSSDNRLHEPDADVRSALPRLGGSPYTEAFSYQGDRVYVGNNNLANSSGQTAMVDWSLDAASGQPLAGFATNTIEVRQTCVRDWLRFGPPSTKVGLCTSPFSAPSLGRHARQVTPRMLLWFVTITGAPAVSVRSPTKTE